MSNRCPKCGRPVSIEPTEAQCYEADSPMCRAFRYGLRLGVDRARQYMEKAGFFVDFAEVLREEKP